MMAANCHICSQPLPYRPNGRGRGRPRKVHVECEAEARRRASAEWRATRSEKPLCDICHTVPVPLGKGWSKFCSPACRQAGANARRRACRAESVLNT